jgi:hypothetical protein
MTQAGGATRAEPQRSERPQPDRPQRTERPMPERPQREPAASNGRNNSADEQLNAAGKSPLAAPRAGNAAAGRGAVAMGRMKSDEDDDFAGTDVSSLLG